MPADDLASYLGPTAFIDSDHPDIVAFTARAVGDATGAHDRALKLFYAVRDDFRYDPYAVDMRPEGFRASTCLHRGVGFCVTKAVLLAACLRADGVPARLGFADVRNHLVTERLRQMMGTDVFAFHGYTDVYLNGKWVKATPAFNIGLCEKFRVLPLDFDGVNDSIFHPFDADGRKHMEYVRDRGVYADLPFDEIRDTFAELYPYMSTGDVGGDFHAEAEAEVASTTSG